MSEETNKRDLLYGLLALDLQIVSPADFVAAMRAWADNRDAALPDLLMERKVLTRDDHAAVQHILLRQLERDAQDTDKSLDSMAIPASVRSELSQIEHPALQAHLSEEVSVAETAPIQQPVRRMVDDTLALTETAAPRTEIAAPRTEPSGTPRDQRFVTLRPHAKGGLGEVHVALDRELSREVAFKQIQSRFIDDGMCRQRFQFEAEVTGQLEHPSIVPVYSAGKDEHGAPYYAMRFIQGDSLHDEIKRFHQRQHNESDRAIGLRRLINHLLDACHAVSFAHSRGVLHRDIKPQNIMVGSFNETFVVDWGLAKCVSTGGDSPAGSRDSVSSSNPGVTAPGAVAGTPAFMSPEQAAGKHERMSAASDIYSLGATLYSILTGQRAFPQKDSLQVLDKVRAGDFDPPIQVSRDVPRPLNAICLKAMARDPSDRYGSASEFAADVERWLAGEPVQAWPEPWSVRTRRWMNRHRTLVTATVATLLALAVGLTAVVAVQLKANRDMSDANLALTNSNTELTQTSAELKEANFQLTESNRQLGEANRNLEVARDRAVARSDLAINAIEGLYNAVNDNLDVRNRPDLADVRDAIIETPRAFFEEFKSELLDSDDTSPEARFRLARVYNQLGNLSRMVSSQEGAVEMYLESIGILEGLVAAEPEVEAYAALQADVHNSLGGMYHNLENTDRAHEQYQIVREIREGMLAGNPDDIESQIGLGVVLHNQAMLYSRAGDLDAAIASAQEGMDLLRDVVAAVPEHRHAKNSLLRSSEILGTTYYKKGELKLAREVLEEAVPVAESAISDDPADVLARQTLAYLHNQLWPIYAGMREPETARISMRTALELYEELARERPSSSQFLLDLGEIKNTWASVLLAEDQIESGMAALLEARDLGEQLIEQHPENERYRKLLNRVMLTLGNQYYAQGQKEKSIEVFRELIPVQQGLVDINPQDVTTRRNLAGLHYNLGYLLADVGRTDDSFEYYNRSLDLRRELATDFPDQPVLRNDLAQTLGNLAGLHDRRNAHRQALELAMEAQQVQEQIVASYPDQRDFQVDLGRTLASVAALNSSLGQIDEAILAYKDALNILIPLVKLDPVNAQQRMDLAGTYRGLGQLHTRLREFDEAEAALNAGQDILEKLFEEQPENVAHRQSLARLLAEKSHFEVQRDLYEEAIATADRANELMAPLLSANANDQSALRVAKIAYMSRSQAHARLGDVEKAREDWEKSWGADADGTETEARDLKEVWIHLWIRDFGGLDREIANLMDRELTSAQSFDVARVASRAATESEEDGFASRFADQGIEFLRRAAVGNALTASQRASLRYDDAFDAIRDRKEFEAVLNQ